MRIVGAEGNTMRMIRVVAILAALGAAAIAADQKVSIHAVRSIPELSRQKDTKPDVPMEFTSVASMSFTIQGDQPATWYDPRRLDGKVRIYVASHQVPFSFSNTCAQIWLFAGTNARLARLEYYSGIGKPALAVDIDRNGEVVRHALVTAVD
jgi:hypothetical protein